MSTSYDEDDERPSRLTHVIYNVTLGHVRVRSEDGPATTVEVAPGDVRFRRVLGAVEPEAALWLASSEQDYLTRMLGHVLSTMNITPEARAALEVVQEKLANLAPSTFDAAEGRLSALELEEPPLPSSGAEADSVAVVEMVEDEASAGGGVDRGVAPPPLVDEDDRAQPPPPLVDEDASAQPPPPRRPTPVTAALRPPEDARPAAGGEAPPSALPGAREGRSRATVARPAARARGGRGGEPAVRRAASPSGPNPVPFPSRPAAPVPTPAPAEASAPPRELGQAIPFSTVWADLQALSARRMPLHRLAGQTSTELREIDDDGVWIYSNTAARTFQVTREQLQGAWAILVNTGRLVPREVRLSHGAVTLLAHLPYVEYSSDPVTLYYPATLLHALGSVRRRDDD